MKELSWTINKPTEGGWYWCKAKNINHPFIIFLFADPLPADGFLWCGPLTPPEDNKEK